MDNLVLNQHTIPYIHVAKTVPIFINLFTWHLPKIPNLYLPNVDHMMVVLNYLTYLTCLRNGRFWWEDSKISQNAMTFIANMSIRQRNTQNFPFDHT